MSKADVTLITTIAVHEWHVSATLSVNECCGESFQAVSDLSSAMNRKVELSTSYFFFSGNTIHYTNTPTTSSRSAAALFMPHAILRALCDICT